MDYSKTPKIELHLHLDCSLSYTVVQKIDSSISEESYTHSFIAPKKCLDLADYISRAAKGYELMQTKEQLQLVTEDLFEQLLADSVIYAEIRFAPLLHTAQGLTPEEIVATVNEATSAAIAATGIEAGLILCTLRHYTAAQSMETVRLVEQFKGTHVLGFDIAADEAGFPIDNHKAAFQYAKENKIKCTAHAGEAKGAESVWETLDYFHPLRIGHGVRAAEDPKLLTFLKANNIHLEVCPTSNVQTNVFDTIEDHNASLIYETGVSMSINTDCRTVSNVSLEHEYKLLERIFNWSKEHFKKCNLEAIQHAFTSEAVKEKLRFKIETAYK